MRVPRPAAGMITITFMGAASIRAGGGVFNTVAPVSRAQDLSKTAFDPVLGFSGYANSDPFVNFLPREKLCICLVMCGISAIAPH